MNGKPQFGQQKPGPSTSHHQGMKSPIEVGGNQAPPDKPLTLGEHLNGVLNFVADSLFGSTGQDSSQDSNSSFADALRKKQKESESNPELKKQKHLARHKELQMTEVYDLEKRKSQELIAQIKKELELLVKEIKTVDSSVQTAVFQEETNPGTYHVNFFTQLRNFLILLRRRVKDGATWLSMFQSKKQKSHYMKMSKKYGSQYMFGQEGQGLTRQNG